MKKVTINYTGSGVKTLRFAGALFLICGVIASIALFEMSSTGYKSSMTFYSFMLMISPSILGLVTFGVCRGLAKLVELAIIAKEQRTALLEKEGIQIEFIIPRPTKPPVNTPSSSPADKSTSEPEKDS